MPELVSGKSNSVSGNYTCRVGLVQTQLRCKTRGEGCKRKSTSFLFSLSVLLLMHCCDVQCRLCPSTPPKKNKSLSFLLPLSLSCSLSLPSPPFSLILPPDKTAAVPISLRGQKVTAETDTSFNTAPCCPESRTAAQSRREKQRLQPRTSLAPTKHQLIHERLHEYIHYMLLKCQS